MRSSVDFYIKKQFIIFSLFIFLNRPFKAIVTTSQPNQPFRGSPTPGPIRGTPTPGPIRGSPTPGPIRGTPTPGPIRGTPTPGPIRGSPTPGPFRGTPTPGPIRGTPTPRGQNGIDAFNILQSETERLSPEEQLFNSVLQQAQDDNVVTRPKEDPLLRRPQVQQRPSLTRPQTPRRLEQPRSQVAIKSLPPRPREPATRPNVVPRPSAPRKPASTPTLPRDPVRFVLFKHILCNSVKTISQIEQDLKGYQS